MGKGDKKTKRGKIANKSYGARRPGKIKRRPTVEQKITPKKKA
ncbi:MAG: 30S ribosomal protein THX [Flavobacteriaceae bacterium]